MNETHMPLVSVLMPVYNLEEYVGEAIESILAQTFTDFEFIIVDDSSTDGSAQIIRGYAEGDARVRVLKSPPKRRRVQSQKPRTCLGPRRVYRHDGCR